jgi:hypothetical protein
MAAKANKKPQRPAGADPAPNPRAVPGDNAKAKMEAAQAQLISFMSKLQAQKVKTEAKAAELKSERDAEKEIKRLAALAGFKAYQLEEYSKDLRTSVKDLVEAETERRWHREALGLPNGATQMDAFDERTPLETRDEAYWRAEGYQAYWRGEDRKPDAKVPERFMQAWLKGFDDGQTAVAMAMKKTPAAEPKATAPPSREAGYEVAKLKDVDGWVTDDPTGAEFGDTHPTEEAAWLACDAHLAANPPVPVLAEVVVEGPAPESEMV